MNCTKRTVLLLFSFLALLAASAYFHYEQTHATVRIGINLNFTDATAAVHTEQGIELAADMINESGGLLGKPVKLITVDNKNSADMAGTAMEVLSLRHVSAVIGPNEKALADSAVPVAEAEKLALISPAVTPASWRGAESPRPYPHVFQLALTPVQEGRAMAAYAQAKLHKKHPLIIYDSRNEASAAAALAYNESAPGSVTDIKAVSCEDIFTLLENEKPDVIYLPVPGKTAAAYITNLRRGHHDLPVLGSSLWTTDDLTALLPPAYLTNLFYSDQYANDPLYTAGETFAERYYEKYGLLPDKYAALGYDAGVLIAAAIKTAGSINSSAVAAALASVRNLPGAAGVMTVCSDHGIDRAVHILSFWQGEPALSDRQTISHKQ